MTAVTAEATLTAERVRLLAVTLPPWRPHLDDDPNWMVPVEAVGLQVADTADDADAGPYLHRAFKAVGKVDLPPPVEVPLAEVTLTGQAFVRIDALAHYLTPEADRAETWPGPGTNPRRLFDFEGWYGTDDPVLIRTADRTAYVVADGNNRVGAAKLRGDATLRAHIFTPPVVEPPTELVTVWLSDRRVPQQAGEYRHDADAWWVRIEREDGPDMLYGSFATEAAAVRCMEDSLLIEGELSPGGGGGVDCYVQPYSGKPYPSTDCDVVLVDHNDPTHTGVGEE